MHRKWLNKSNIYKVTESQDQQFNKTRSSGSINRVWTLCLLQLTDQGERPHVGDDKGMPVLLYSLNVW